MLEIVFDGKPCRIVDTALPMMKVGVFRSLDAAEEQAFRHWAWTQAPGAKVNPTWHPVVQDELLVSGRGEE